MIQERMKYTEKIAKRLNVLLAKTTEAEQAYQLGADWAEKPPLKRFLKRMEKQRHSFNLELEREIRAYGHQPVKPQKAIFPIVSKNRAIPVAIANAETNSLRVYEYVLADPETNLPPPTKRILTKQKEGILDSLRSEYIP
jgi:hypothetical protein